ncbi:MAG TPA: hypothetical protein VFT39_05410 [Vicinamibacterales bacterium]|nr:hypothetical protein [Vicinamibacterales bacterium]
MKQRIAMLCCVMMFQSSVVIAGETGDTLPVSSVSVSQQQSNMGPLRRASNRTQSGRRLTQPVGNRQ